MIIVILMKTKHSESFAIKLNQLLRHEAAVFFSGISNTTKVVSNYQTVIGLRQAH